MRVLGAKDSTQLKAMRPVLDRALARMARDIDSGRLIGESTTATSEALLGVLALDKTEHSAANTALAQRTADLIAGKSAGTIDVAPWGAHVDAPTAPWHA